MMTAPELQEEWEYRFNERLGIMCEDREPTPEQVRVARTEADKAVAELKEKA